MGNIIYLGVLIFLWVVLQYIIYIYIYYRYEICKEQKHIVIYRNSKFICYIVALIISICAVTIFFEKYNSITMFKEIIFLRSDVVKAVGLALVTGAAAGAAGAVVAKAMS